MKKLIIILASFWATSPALAFINIETIRKIPGEGFVGSSGLQVTGQDGNTNKVSSRVSTLGVMRYTRDELLFTGDYLYGTSFNVKDTNRGHGHLRYTFFHREKIAYETFVQSEFDEFKDLNSRNLIGANVRNRIRSDDSHILYLGYGAFYEVENFIGNDDHEGFRGNFYVSYSYKLNDLVAASLTTYYQPLLKDVETHRIRLQSGLDIKIDETLGFDIDFNLTHDNGLPPDVKPTDIDYLVGMTIKY